MRIHLSILLAAAFLQGALAEEQLHFSVAQKQWGLAASAVLTQCNGQDLFSLTGVPNSTYWLEGQRMLLKRAWGVSSREELLATMTRLRDGGHRASYDKACGELAAPKSKVQQFLSALTGDRPSPAYRIEFVKKHAAEIGDKSLTGWDLPRLICLARWGVGAGYLDENEAWGWIMPAAAEIQATYASWSELGAAYLLGREFWSPAAMRENGYEDQDAVYWLEHNQYSPWVNFDWNLNLRGGSDPAEDASVPETQLYFYGASCVDSGDYDEALRILLEASEKGSELSRGKAFNKLGVLYIYGRPGIAKDLNKALAFYEEGVRLGNEGSLSDLGYAYYNGTGRPRDYAKALDLWSRAMEQGSVVAINNLGLIYARGNGVKKDVAKALEFHQRALDLGARGADNSIAWLMYENEELWDADEAVRHAYVGLRKKESLYVYDSLVKVLIKAERWDEANQALNAWVRFDMGERDNYDELALPLNFKRLRSIIQEKGAADEI